MITLACFSPDLQGQGAEMKVPAPVYQHQRYTNHTPPGNQASARPAPHFPYYGNMLCLSQRPEWQEVRSLRAAVRMEVGTHPGGEAAWISLFTCLAKLSNF